jgi:phage terminase large subunit-like protein
MGMQCIVDRFEGDYAVIEYHNQVLNLPRVFLPAETHEGDVLDIVVLLDDNETGKMKAEINRLMEEVWEK